MDLSQRVDLRQELHLTTEIKQGIAVLQMTAADLSEYVQQCVEENPFLDDSDWDWPQHPFGAGEYARKVSADALSERSSYRGESAGGGSLQGDGFAPVYGAGAVNADELIDRYFPEGETLAEHLLAQLSLQDLSAEQRRAGEFIAESLDGSGYLPLPLEAVAQLAGVSSRVARDALELVQQLDPPGVGARNLAECLQVQLEARGLATSATDRVLGELDALGSLPPARFAQKLGMSLPELEEVLAAMRQCNPRPGAQFGRSSDPIWPEIIVERAGEPGCYDVRLQDFYLPHLQVNARYKTMAATEKNRDTEAYLHEKLKEAEALIDNIAYRRATLYKVACCVVEMQADFFDEGFCRIRPLTMEQVARACDLSEATVSRVANGNYLQTPRGLFELRFFFQPAASNEDGRDVSQASVKYRIRQIVQEEDPRRPLSDQGIADMLAAEGAAVSRRTVNKYRTDLGIPAQSFRRRA